MTDAHQNLELKTFSSRRLNSDSEAGLLEINDVTDAQFFAFISIRLLWRFVLRAFFTLTRWHCRQHKRQNEKVTLKPGCVRRKSVN